MTKFYAGVDGGGTKTAVLCVNEQGESVASATFGPFNINSVGREGVRRVMREILGFLSGQGACLRLCIGAAGCGNTAVREEIGAVMSDFPGIPYDLAGDFEIARFGALGGRPGIALVAGTGSVCSGVNAAGETFRAGGWGHLIGDGGSGYAIGRDALRELTLARDGMADSGRLCRLLESELHLTDRDRILKLTYGNDKSAIAAVSACVLKAAEKTEAQRDAASIPDNTDKENSDPAAVRILRENAAELARLVRAVAERLAVKAPELVLLGGLLERDNCYRRMVIDTAEEAVPGIRCVEPVCDPARGAALMAMAGEKGTIHG